MKSLIKNQGYPWLTPTVREMMRIRDKAYSKCRSTGLEVDIRFYKEMKSIVNKALFSEKTAFFQRTAQFTIRRFQALHPIQLNLLIHPGIISNPIIFIENTPKSFLKNNKLNVRLKREGVEVIAGWREKIELDRMKSLDAPDGELVVKQETIS
ncbi:hypothetical protein ACJJTC_010502 [Scirpophaga incertulas]